MNPSARLAEFVKQISYETIPAKVVYRTKQIMLDTLACSVAGYTMAKEECGWIIKFVTESEDKPKRQCGLMVQRHPA